MNITKKDVVWNYIGIILKVGINVIILPLILVYLTEEELGLWYIFASIGNIAILFDFGFAATLARNIAYVWSGAQRLVNESVVVSNKQEPNYKLLKEVLETCRYIYLVISLIAAILLFTGGTGYILWVTKNDSNNIYIYSWIIYALGVFLNLYYGYFTSFLKGVGAIAENNKAITIAKLIQVVVSLIGLKMGYGLFAVSLAYFLSGIGLRGISKKYFLRYEKIGEHFKELRVKLEFGKIKENFLIIWHNAWRDGLVSLANYAMTQMTTLICSMRLSLQETGQYGLCLQMVTLLANISMSLYGTYQPKLQSYCVHNEKDKSRELFSGVIINYFLLMLLGGGVIITIGVPVINIIKPGYELNRWVLAGMIVYAMLYYCSNLCISYISNTNKVPYVKAYCFSAVATLTFELILIYPCSLGIWGIILGQMLGGIIYNWWKWPKEVLEILEINANEFIRKGIRGTKAQILRLIKR